MYPKVMPQAELVDRLQDAAKIVDKSWALREVGEDRRGDSSSSSSSSGSGEERSVGVSVKRQSPEARPRSNDRRRKAERRSFLRSQSEAPQLQRSTMEVGDGILEPGPGGARRQTRARSSAPMLENPERRKRSVATSKDDLKKEAVAENRKKPNALSFLDADSPEITEGHIRQVVEESSGEWSPRSVSSSSSSNDSIGQRSNADTDATTPEHSINGDGPVPQVAEQGEGAGEDDAQERYGTPEMTRGPMKHPHLPPKELQPRIAAPGQGHAKHLPRAEKLPMSGYELLAAKLSSSENPRSKRRGSMRSNHTDDGEPSIKPIYRRFEGLNHRLLLHLQDELSELEEQLHRLDTTDTQTRRLANCILPASRRAEFMAGGELQWHKTDILGNIGFKLGQYNQVLTSFTETQNLPPASLSDIESYRTYLATKNPIAEIETRFLDPAHDLICLESPKHSRRSSSSSSNSSSAALSEEMLTPMPLKTTFCFSPSSSSTTTAHASRKQSLDSSSHPPLRKADIESSIPSSRRTFSPQQMTTTAQLASLGALAIIGPIFAFQFVGDFVARMAIVLVVGLVVAALRGRMDEKEVADVSEQVVKGEGSSGDVMVLVGSWGVVMGVLAILV